MPIYNHFIRHTQTGQNNPAGLRVIGAFFPIEVHVPPLLAQALTDQEQPIPAPISGTAIIDTGATITCIHEPILTGLGLNPIGVVNSGTARGVVQQSLYAARIVFPTRGWTVNLQGVAGVDLTGQVIPTDPPQPVIGLLGRNILERWVLIWNGPGGFWTVAM